METSQVKVKENSVAGESIRVTGLVQGVGFRPTVWRIARQLALTGSVYNDGAGVVISLWGPLAQRQQFLTLLQQEPPPLARIDDISSEPLAGVMPQGLFEIVASRGGVSQTSVAGDAAVCQACRSEVLDPKQRRYRYPFTNCTHCGPRLSIVKSIPYDRANTAMANFPMCQDCQQEYQDPSDRRFHAQPIACHACGPRVWLEDRGAKELDPKFYGEQDPIAAAVLAIRRGDIVAIKGIGGFHLACDGHNHDAIARLRARKNRPDKPFALMARDINQVEQYCQVSPAESALLKSSEAPIVLLENRRVLPDNLAPSIPTLGFMLPYTPLHLLLLMALDHPIVMTSGNPSGAPQCIDNNQAREQLKGLADYWLMHDRDIVNRVDDSVIRLINQQPHFLRRARGYAPSPVKLPPGFEQAPPILAFGGELKNTICLLKDSQAVLSQYIGDLEQPSALAAFEQTIDRYLNMFELDPQLLAVDAHPEYLSTKHGTQLSQQQGLTLTKVQHHHAHMASCLADNQRPLAAQPILGIVLDGLGFGSDGSIWGGEILLANYQGFERLACLKPVPLPGGVQAIRQPWRNCFSQLETSLGCDYCFEQFSSLELMTFLKQQPINTLKCMISQQINCPMSSSCGRLFDGVAAALGICRDGISYEGQAAIELEALAASTVIEAGSNGASYPFTLEDQAGLLQINGGALWQALLQDLSNDVPRAIMAQRFHQGLATVLVSCIKRLWQLEMPRLVALSGGVFQNKILLEAVTEQLNSADFEVLQHQQIPSNDGGLALGQAVIAAAQQLAVCKN